MDRSYVGATPHHLAADRSHGYRIDGDSVTDVGADFDPGVTIPNSGWNAPVDDVVRYVAFLTGAAADAATRARYDGTLRRATLEEMWRPIVETGNALPEFAAVGLGFFSLADGGRRVVGHTGDQAGYRSYVYIDPSTSAAVILIFNYHQRWRGGGPRDGGARRGGDAGLALRTAGPALAPLIPESHRHSLAAPSVPEAL